MEELKQEVEKIIFTPYGLIEPWEGIVNPYLSHLEHRLLGLLMNTGRSKEGCTLTDEFLTLYFNCSKSSITHSISSLKRYGYIISKVHCVKNKDGEFQNSRSIFNNTLISVIYKDAVEFFHSYSCLLPPKILWEQIQEKIPSVEQIQLYCEETFDTVPNNRKQLFGRPNNRKQLFGRPNNRKQGCHINNTNIIPSSLNNKDKSLSLKKEGNEDSSNLSFPNPSDSHLRKNKPPIEANSDIKVIKKLNRRNLQVEPESIPLLKPAEKKPSLKAMASAGMQADAEKKKADYKAKKKIIPFQNIEPPIQEIIDLWEHLKFPPLNKEKAPGRFNDTIRALRKIQKGKLIPNETRKFSIEEIKNAMIRFSMLAFDNCGFHSPENRKKYAEKTLECFLYTWVSEDTLKKYPDYTQSWFVKCHDMKEEPKKQVNLNAVEDLHPPIKNKLVGFYYDYALAGLKKRLTEVEENKFREAANKICVLYDQNKDRFAGVNGYHEMADMLCQSIYQSYGKRTTMVHPGSFCSPNAMAGMIKFMNEKGCIPDAGSLIQFR